MKARSDSQSQHTLVMNIHSLYWGKCIHLIECVGHTAQSCRGTTEWSISYKLSSPLQPQTIGNHWPHNACIIARCELAHTSPSTKAPPGGHLFTTNSTSHVNNLEESNEREGGSGNMWHTWGHNKKLWFHREPVTTGTPLVGSHVLMSGLLEDRHVWKTYL